MKPTPSPFLDEIHRGWIHRGWDPTLLARFRMDGTGDGGQGAPAPGTGAAGAGGSVSDSAAQLAALQQTIDAAAATASQQARDDAIAAALKDTGFTSLEDLQAAAKAKIDADNAAKDETTRAREAADREKAEAAAAKADAAKATFNANLQTFLVQCGVPAAALADASVLVSAELGFAVDAEADKVVAAAAKVRDRQPALFSPATDPGGGGAAGRAPSGTTGRPPAGKTTTGVEAGIERAKAARAARSGATREDLIRQFTPGNGSSPLAPTA